MNLNEIPVLINQELVKGIATYHTDSQSKLHKMILEEFRDDEVDILFAAGADSCLQLLFSFFDKKGKQIYIPSFSYPGFSKILDQLEICFHYYDQNNHLKFLSELSAQESENSIVVMCRPNNPDGSICQINEKTFLDYKGVLIIDESYFEFLPHDCFQGQDLLKKRKDVYLIRSFSKTFGAPGLRLGYLVGKKDSINDIKKKTLPFLISNLAYERGYELWKSKDLVLKNVETLRWSANHLRIAIENLQYITSQTSTYFFVFRDSDNSLTLKLHQYLLSNNCILPLLPDAEGLQWIRISTSDSNTNKMFLLLLEKFKQDLQSHS